MTQYQQNVLNVANRLAELANDINRGGAKLLIVEQELRQAGGALCLATEAELKRTQPVPAQPGQPPVPTIGRLVRYVLSGGELQCGQPRAALISGLPCTYKPDQPGYHADPFRVNLHVFFDGQRTEFVAGVPYGAEHGHGTWHWPERS